MTNDTLTSESPSGQHACCPNHPPAELIPAAGETPVRKPRSGGPRTPAGKARSRMNALKHGAYATLPVLRTENEAAFHQFLELYYTHFAPASEIERRLVGQLASIDWRLARYINIETKAIDSKLDTIHHNPLSPEAADDLQITLFALNAALLQPGLAFAGQREAALARVREITLRTLHSLRRHHPPLDSTPAYLSLQPERTSQPIDSIDPATETNWNEQSPGTR